MGERVALGGHFVACVEQRLRTNDPVPTELWRPTKFIAIACAVVLCCLLDCRFFMMRSIGVNPPPMRLSFRSLAVLICGLFGLYNGSLPSANTAVATRPVTVKSEPGLSLPGATKDAHVFLGDTKKEW